MYPYSYLKTVLERAFVGLVLWVIILVIWGIVGVLR